MEVMQPLGHMAFSIMDKVHNLANIEVTNIMGCIIKDVARIMDFVIKVVAKIMDFVIEVQLVIKGQYLEDSIQSYCFCYFI